MITTAITGVFVAALAGMGVDPTPYAVPIWIAVKVVIVTPLVGGAMVMKKKMDDKKSKEDSHADPS